MAFFATNRYRYELETWAIDSARQIGLSRVSKVEICAKKSKNRHFSIKNHEKAKNHKFMDFEA